MVSGSVPLITVLETSRNSIMTRGAVLPGRLALLLLARMGFEVVQTLSATMRAPSGGRMDAVALVQRDVGSHAVEQERDERECDTPWRARDTPDEM